MTVLMKYDGRNGNGYQPLPKPPTPPPKRIINESVELGRFGGWYLFGCFWCVFCLGVAVGGIIVRINH